jgi:hypothetical protein
MPTERAGRILTFDMRSAFTCRPFRIVRVAHHALWQAFRAGRAPTWLAPPASAIASCRVARLAQHTKSSQWSDELIFQG